MWCSISILAKSLCMRLVFLIVSWLKCFNKWNKLAYCKKRNLHQKYNLCNKKFYNLEPSFHKRRLICLYFHPQCSFFIQQFKARSCKTFLRLDVRKNWRKLSPTFVELRQKCFIALRQSVSAAPRHFSITTLSIDTQHKDTQHKDTQHNGFICDTQHKWHSAQCI